MCTKYYKNDSEELYKEINLFDGNVRFLISYKDWEFLCNTRFFTDNPSEQLIQAEFVTGTGITSNTPELWKNAGNDFMDYIDYLRNVQNLDINNMCRKAFHFRPM